MSNKPKKEKFEDDLEFRVKLENILLFVKPFAMNDPECPKNSRMFNSFFATNYLNKMPDTWRHIQKYRTNITDDTLISIGQKLDLHYQLFKVPKLYELDEFEVRCISEIFKYLEKKEISVSTGLLKKVLLKLISILGDDSQLSESHIEQSFKSVLFQ